VNTEIWRLIQRANEVVTEIYHAGDEYADSRAEYELDHSREVLKASGTIQEKKALADGQCAMQYKRFLKAEVRYKYLKTVLDTTREQLGAAQSIGANMREEWHISQRHST
jgi:hypothetical protein